MPPTLESPDTVVRPGSFADMLGGDDAPNPAPETPNDEPTPDPTPKPVVKPTPEPKAPKEDPKPEVKPKETAKPDANPHLDDEPAPKVEKKPEPVDEEAPKGMTAKAQESWKTIKAAQKEAVAGLAAAQAELAATKAKLDEASKGGEEVTRLKEEREALQKQLEEMQSEISVSRIEATPEFKSKVSGPIKASEAAVRELAAKYEIGPAALLDALHEPDANKRADMLSELATDFKGYDSKRLFDAADAYALATTTAEELRANASTRLETMTKQQQAEAERAATENIQGYRKAAGAAWSELQERLPILRPADGKDAWNARLDGIRQKIEALPINELPVQDVARMAAAEMALEETTKAYQHFQRVSKEQREEITKLKAQLEDVLGSAAPAGGGSRDDDTPSKGPQKFADIPGAED